jgi:hypothetical protein
MQTFFPYANVYLTAKVLDYKRLGKQRVEGMQLVNALEGRSKGWVNHPAAIMWRNNVDALKHYTNVMIEEWVARGYNNSMQFYNISEVVSYPKWLGWECFHASHRSNLLRKDPVFYGKYGWKESADLEYYWPGPG